MDTQPRDRSPDRRDAAGRSDSLDLILGYARQSYDQQLARLETYRSRAGSLLAFAAVLVTLSAGTAPGAGRSVAQAAGTLLVSMAAVLFLAVSLGEGLRVAPSVLSLARSDLADPPHVIKSRLLRNTLDVLGPNQRTVARLGAVPSIGLLCLVAGTIVIGVRVTLLLL